MHESPHGEMRHHQAVEFLTHQVWGFATEHDLRTTQVSFQFIHCGFDLPAFVIKGCQFVGWCTRLIQNAGQEAIPGLGIGHPFQRIFNYPYRGSMGAPPAVLLRSINATKIGTVWQAFFAGQE
jgi:hypothetical protein